MRNSPSCCFWCAGSTEEPSHLNPPRTGPGVATCSEAAEDEMIRLALAEDHTIVRWALREALSKAEDIEVVGEAGTAAETLSMIQNVKPDVLLLDITLPDRSGFDVLAELRNIETAPLVVVLTWHTEPSYAARAIAAGAPGYVKKAHEH